MTAKVRVELNKPQHDAFSLLTMGVLLVLVFGRGVGKSYTHRTAWWKLIAEHDGRRRPGGPADLRGIRIILLMPTFKQAVDTYSRAVIDDLTGTWAFLGGVVNKTRWRIDFPGGSWIQFFGAENVDSARGMRCDMVSADEADDIDEASYEAVAVPWLSEPWSFSIQLISGTPRRGRFGLLHKQYRLAAELNENGGKKHPGCHSLHATYRDAPRQVSTAFVEMVRATMAPNTFNREWEASFDAGEGLVYPFDDACIQKFDPKAGWTEVLIGCDWGWSDPGVYLAVGVRGSGREAVCHVIEEVYEPQQVESWWLDKARHLKKRYPTARWFGDPSQPARIEALRREAGVNIIPGENNIYDGVDSVADRLVKRIRQDGSSQVRFYVDPRCANTIREFNTYRRRRDSRDPERVLDEIEDRNNHAMDSLRYAIFTRFGKPGAIRTEIA